jgi:hypothetical protein
MPLSNETVPNRPLSGKELVELVLQDVREVMERDGRFSVYAAYGRVAYTVRVDFHLANPLSPTHQVNARAKMRPEVPQVEGTPPLTDPGEDSARVTLERDRTIDSPNANRIASGLPVTITSHEEGKIVERVITYGKDDLPPDKAPPAPVDRDLSPAAPPLRNVTERVPDRKVPSLAGRRS